MESLHHDYHQYRRTLWPSRKGFQFGALAAAQRKNAETKLAKKALALLNDITKAPELLALFEEKNVPSEILPKMGQLLTTGSSRYLRFLSDLVDFFPGCLLLYYTVTKLLTPAATSNPSYTQTYDIYKSYLTNIIHSEIRQDSDYTSTDIAN